MDKQCSRAELEHVMSIIEAGTYLEEWESALTRDAETVMAMDHSSIKNNERAILSLHHRIITSLQAEKEPVPLYTAKSNWKLISSAAAAIVLLLGGWWFFNDQNSSATRTKDHIVYDGDIAPGRQGATLTLGSGKKVILNSSKSGIVIAADKMQYNDGSEVAMTTNLSKIDLYTASTAVGNTYMFTLPDGTRVWLNAASQLDFPSKFDTQNRVVKLKGEAYFQVAKDKTHPFIVESNGQQVKVLGTHFNINSYADEKTTKTTLLEGSVQLLTSSLLGDRDTGVILKPGQQSVLSPTGTLTVSKVDTALATAWKDNKFIFEHNDIQSVMRMVQRWYQMDVVYAGPLPEATFGGKVSRFSNISNVLRVLETTGGVHFKIEGRKVYVSK